MLRRLWLLQLARGLVLVVLLGGRPLSAAAEIRQICGLDVDALKRGPDGRPILTPELSCREVEQRYRAGNLFREGTRDYFLWKLVKLGNDANHENERIPYALAVDIIDHGHDALIALFGATASWGFADVPIADPTPYHIFKGGDHNPWIGRPRRLGKHLNDYRGRKDPDGGRAGGNFSIPHFDREQITTTIYRRWRPKRREDYLEYQARVLSRQINQHQLALLWIDKYYAEALAQAVGEDGDPRDPVILDRALAASALGNSVPFLSFAQATRSVRKQVHKFRRLYVNWKDEEFLRNRCGENYDAPENQACVRDLSIPEEGEKRGPRERRIRGWRSHIERRIASIERCLVLIEHIRKELAERDATKTPPPRVAAAPPASPAPPPDPPPATLAAPATPPSSPVSSPPGPLPPLALASAEPPPRVPAPPTGLSLLLFLLVTLMLLKFRVSMQWQTSRPDEYTLNIHLQPRALWRSRPPTAAEHRSPVTPHGRARFDTLLFRRRWRLLAGGIVLIFAMVVVGVVLINVTRPGGGTPNVTPRATVADQTRADDAAAAHATTSLTSASQQPITPPHDAVLEAAVDALVKGAVNQPVLALNMASDADEQETLSADEDTASTVASDGMVAVPAGSFEPGYHYTQTTPNSANQIFLEAFEIDRFEVTQDAYRACVDADVCDDPECWSHSADAGQHPVTCITWFDARDYCTWKGKRLPLEIEWERAAKGTSLRIYPWGDDEPNCARTQYARCGRVSIPVGSRTDRSADGVIDLGGNVSEWVQDRYDAPRPDQPATRREARLRRLRVIRGGNFSDPSRNLRIERRHISWPKFSSETVGFRCARDLETAASRVDATH